TDQLPYGIHELVELATSVREAPRTVRCYVRGCQHELRTPTRLSPGEVCPDHGIRCHYSRNSSTYSYRDVRRNIIASKELFAQRIVRHPFKYESHRLGLEKSEDTLSWNVFRSLQEAGCLRQLAALITGEDLPYEPHLYLWGICTTEDSLEPWDLLIQARERFENNLPVERPQTEPDIALHLPGQYLILIEAKFTSPNTFYGRGPRRNPQSLTLDELLEIYHDQQLAILNHAKAAEAPRVAYQLWRNTVFAEWMAAADHPHTKAYHVNLVRSGFEQDAADEFAGLIDDNHKDRFRRLTWEQIYTATPEGQLPKLRQYMRTKTAGLKPAFRIEAN
ncbi:MAG: hypothetical protein RJP95_01715, partial [Pirellulales bacterium]